MTTIHKFDETIFSVGHVTEHDILTFHWVTWVEHRWTDGEGSMEFISVKAGDFLE